MRYAQGMKRSYRLWSRLLSAGLAVIALLVHQVGLAEPDEPTDRDVAKALSYLTLSVRDRECYAKVANAGEGYYDRYDKCMRANREISYCKARQVDFEELAMVMASDKDLSSLLPLDPLVKYVSARCIEVDGFLPPPLPIVAIERPEECGTGMSALVAYAVNTHLPKERNEENSNKELRCRGNAGLSFLRYECWRILRGLDSAGHKHFCVKPQKSTDLYYK